MHDRVGHTSSRAPDDRLATCACLKKDQTESLGIAVLCCSVRHNVGVTCQVKINGIFVADRAGEDYRIFQAQIRNKSS